MKALYLAVTLLIVITVTAQNKKNYTINRTSSPPKIDGVLNDTVWQTATKTSNFIEFRPTAGKTFPEYQSSTVQLAYDDQAIYIAGYFKDNPENIMRQFTKRDNFGQNDFFGIIFNPNNDGQNDTEFFVLSSGTQADAIASPSIGEDFGWNAVWESATKIVDDGWIAEVKIPYAALRFSKQEHPVWGIQFHRLYRKTRQQATWSPFNPKKGYIALYNGELKGLKNIHPPTRLSFYPFISGITDRIDAKTTTNFNAGLDIKYGITENFTIDATLIPDFSQATFDDVELNLGPFEQRFSEQRQFFKEGVDLFSKGNLFYSRRVGGAPAEEPNLKDNEKFKEGMPTKINMLNAVKLSGRTKKNLGIGIFNALTEKTEVTITDTITGNTRNAIAESLANYNILVLDQQFNKNSSISLINTNVIRKDTFRDANVTGVVLDLTNKKNTYGLNMQSNVSNVITTEGADIGVSSTLGFGKKSGKYQYSIQYDFADKNYDINDLGILFRNNYSNISLKGSYRIFKPTKRYNNIWINTWAGSEMLFKPSTYTGSYFGAHIRGTRKKNLLSHGVRFNIQPGKQYDYFGPREDGRYFITENWLNVLKWISTNYNKTFALNANIGYETLFENGRTYESYWYELNPRFKLNKHLLIIYSYAQDNEFNERGYIDTIDNDIIYGERHQTTITNTISANYNFNPFHNLVLSFRNYWSSVEYKNELFSLQENGRLLKDKNYIKQTIDDPDVNFNTWNLNFTYSWQFAPGSLLTAQYRNRIFNKNTNGNEGFVTSLNGLFKESVGNAFSLKLVYFIDYNSTKKWFKSRKK